MLVSQPPEIREKTSNSGLGLNFELGENKKSKATIVDPVMFLDGVKQALIRMGH